MNYFEGPEVNLAEPQEPEGLAGSHFKSQVEYILYD